MSSRAYLSIGDVLTLLREEFPDVTISKIRFLESQRLVNPERSPSGYRKFYEPDVERLRWVLRQQRDHFLPLKVIRDRLARAGNGVPEEAEDESPTRRHPAAAGGHPPDGGPADPGVPGPGEVAAAPESNGPSTGRGGDERPDPGRPDPGRPAVAARVAAAVSATRPATEGSGNGTTVHLPGPHPFPGGSSGTQGPIGTTDGEAGPPVDEPPGGAPAAAGDPEAGGGAHDDNGGARPGSAAAGTAEGAASGTPDPVGSSPEAGGGADPVGGSTGPTGADEQPTARAGEPDPAAAGAPPAHARPGEPLPGGPHAPAHAASGQAAGTPEPAGSPAAAPKAPGASLTLEELCAATGLLPGQIAALETFGLIEPVTVAGGTYYDGEAVTVATLAAELGRYGIEARHLRVFRNAVDREVGLVEQVVAPLLRQRNPAARQRAVDSAHELARLGEQLRASLLRRELRRQLGR